MAAAVMEIFALVAVLIWFAGTIGFARYHFAKERPLLEPGNKHNQMRAHSCEDERCYARRKDGYLTERACVTGGLVTGAAWPFLVPIILTAKGLRTSVTAGQAGLKADRAEVARKDRLALAATVTPETIAQAELEAVRAEEDLQRARNAEYIDGTVTAPVPARQARYQRATRRFSQ